jgi:hypothetical protein
MMQVGPIERFVGLVVLGVCAGIMLIEAAKGFMP